MDTIRVETRHEQGLPAGSYFLRVLHDRMAPKYEPGETAVVSSIQAPAVRDYAVVEYLTAGGVVSRLVGLLIGRNEHCLVFREFNPDREVSLDTASITVLHRVLPMRELCVLN